MDGDELDIVPHRPQPAFNRVGPFLTSLDERDCKPFKLTCILLLDERPVLVVILDTCGCERNCSAEYNQTAFPARSTKGFLAVGSPKRWLRPAAAKITPTRGSAVFITMSLPADQARK